MAVRSQFFRRRGPVAEELVSFLLQETLELLQQDFIFWAEAGEIDANELCRLGAKGAAVHDPHPIPPEGLHAGIHSLMAPGRTDGWMDG